MLRNHGNQPLSKSVIFQDDFNSYLHFSPVKRVPVTPNNVITMLLGLLQKMINEGFVAQHAEVLLGDPHDFLRAGLFEIENQTV